jgi:hypothetical protein
LNSLWFLLQRLSCFRHEIASSLRHVGAAGTCLGVLGPIWHTCMKIADQAAYLATRSEHRWLSVHRYNTARDCLFAAYRLRRDRDVAAPLLDQQSLLMWHLITQCRTKNHSIVFRALFSNKRCDGNVPNAPLCGTLKLHMYALSAPVLCCYLCSVWLFAQYTLSFGRAVDDNTDPFETTKRTICPHRCKDAATLITQEWEGKMPQCIVVQAWEGYAAYPPTQMHIGGAPYQLYGVVARQQHSSSTNSYDIGPHFVSFLYAGDNQCWLQDCAAVTPITAKFGVQMRAMLCAWPLKEPTNLLPHCIRYVFYTRQT